MVAAPSLSLSLSLSLCQCSSAFPCLRSSTTRRPPSVFLTSLRRRKEELEEEEEEEAEEEALYMGNACTHPQGSTVECNRGKRKRKKVQSSFSFTGFSSSSSSSSVSEAQHSSRRGFGSWSRHFWVLESSDGHDVHRRYRLGRELGRGEFGVTHLCVDAESNEELACKSISKEKLRTEIDVEDVRREVEIMRSLPECGNIVRLREAYEDREAIHLVMELCKGGELFDRIVARGHYTERAAAVILKTIVEVVMNCHEHGVMHRDLKPENFLFADKSESSPLKAIDFGLSVFFKPGERFSEIVGSPYYMAPEVLKRNYGPEVDIWSAGVILYILLCGVPPFWAETEEGIAQAIVRSVIDFKREPWPRVSENAKDLVRRMLEPDPKLRLTALQVLEHPWVKNTELTPNVPLGETVTARLKQFSAMNKFKKRALRVVAEQLSVEEMAGIKQMFHMMDTHNKGNLSFEELKVGLHTIGETVPDPDVRMLMDVADDDGNGTLDYGEFVTVSLQLKRISSEEHLNLAFTYFDKNQSGYIEIDELRDALAEDAVGADCEQVIHDIIRDVDLDKDGRISYAEFAAMMKCGTDWRKASRQYSRDLFNNLSLRLLKNGTLQKSYVRANRGLASRTVHGAA